MASKAKTRKVEIVENVTIMINEEARVKGDILSVNDETYERIKDYVKESGNGEVVDAEIVEDKE